MGVSKLEAGLTNLKTSALWYFGFEKDDIELINKNEHPHMYLSKDGLCLFIKPDGMYDLMIKSANGKSESKVGTRLTTAVSLNLRSKSIARQYRAVIEPHPSLERIGPVSCPRIMEPDEETPLRVVLWSAQDIELPEYLCRVYLLT
jgi:hypothetical protein